MKNLQKIRHLNIFDLDGVLLCSKHRYRVDKETQKIDLEHWRANAHRSLLDKPIPAMADIYRGLIKDSSHFVIIATSRIMAAYDYAHIAESLGSPDALISRIHNGQKGSTLKIKGIERIIQDCNLQHVRNSDMHIWEDNPEYLTAMLKHFHGSHGHLIQSEQGH